MPMDMQMALAFWKAVWQFLLVIPDSGTLGPVHRAVVVWAALGVQASVPGGQLFSSPPAKMPPGAPPPEPEPMTESW